MYFFKNRGQEKTLEEIKTELTNIKNKKIREGFTKYINHFRGIFTLLSLDLKNYELYVSSNGKEIYI